MLCSITLRGGQAERPAVRLTAVCEHITAGRSPNPRRRSLNSLGAVRRDHSRTRNAAPPFPTIRGIVGAPKKQIGGVIYHTKEKKCYAFDSAYAEGKAGYIIKSKEGEFADQQIHHRVQRVSDHRRDRLRTRPHRAETHRK